MNTLKYKVLYISINQKSLFSVRLSIGVFMLCLLLSGITAFPLKSEMDFLTRNISFFPHFLQTWILKVKADLHTTPETILYGTDWLAFAHIVISLFFIPVFINPVKFRANLLIGMVACLLVFPLAFICGSVRGIPFFHQLIDCCFGLFGFFFLWFILKETKKL